MKKYILVLAVLILFASRADSSNKIDPVSIQHNNITRLQDGWYKASVEYHNYATYYSNTYELKVRVEYGSISMIAFGNGGSVHSGYNNEGYNYTGGYLLYHYNFSTGDLESVTSSVTVTDSNGTRTFDITIS